MQCLLFTQIEADVHVAILQINERKDIRKPEQMKAATFISFPDLSFPANISSLKLSTIFIEILGPKSDTNKAWSR